MIVKVRLSQPNLFGFSPKPKVFDPLRPVRHMSSARREICLWSAATASFACLLLALTRLGA